MDAPWTSDGFNVGRYEATDAWIFPRDLRRGGYMWQELAVGMLTLIGTLGILALVAVAEWIWLRRKRAPA